ncbi:MAG: ABC transporter ATP-binding protein [Flavobacteriales bacterium]
MLEGLDFSLERGSLVALTGRNGTGKTTLLKTIAGIIDPLSGEVQINGINLHNQNPAARARMVSIVLTNRLQLAGIDVQSLVMMGRYPTQGRFTFETKEDDAIVAESLDKLQITHLAKKPLAELSDGEMQKAMVARVLAQKSPLLIMDEPSAFLDYVAKEELFEMLKSLCRDEGIGILFSSHDLELIKKYADRRLHVEDGRLRSLEGKEEMI